MPLTSDARNYTLERGQGTGATQDLASPRYLPKDKSFRGHKVLIYT